MNLDRRSMLGGMAAAGVAVAAGAPASAAGLRVRRPISSLAFGHPDLDAYRQRLTNFVYHSGFVMKPPARATASISSGTTSPTSPRSMRGPICKRTDSILALSSLFASSSFGAAWACSRTAWVCCAPAAWAGRQCWPWLLRHGRCCPCSMP